MKPSFEVHVHAEHNLIVTCGAVLIHVRNGPLTFRMLDRIEQALQLFRARQAKAMAVLVVLEASALPASDAVRDRQRGIIQMLVDSERLHIATVLLGLGAIFSLQRTVARGISQSSSRIHVSAAVTDAARWMVKINPEIGVNELELRTLIERARDTLRNADPPSPLSVRRFIQ